MAALLFILFYIVCFLLLIFASWLTARIMDRWGDERRYGWAFFWGVIIYLFWDWLPMELSYKYSCDNKAGLTVYMTPEQWQAENPGVLETLVPAKSKSIQQKVGEKSLIRRPLSGRFVRDTYTIDIFPNPI